MAHTRASAAAAARRTQRRAQQRRACRVGGGSRHTIVAVGLQAQHLIMVARRRCQRRQHGGQRQQQHGWPHFRAAVGQASRGAARRCAATCHVCWRGQRRNGANQRLRCWRRQMRALRVRSRGVCSTSGEASTGSSGCTTRVHSRARVFCARHISGHFSRAAAFARLGAELRGAQHTCARNWLHLLRASSFYSLLLCQVRARCRSDASPRLAYRVARSCCRASVAPAPLARGGARAARGCSGGRAASAPLLQQSAEPALPLAALRARAVPSTLRVPPPLVPQQTQRAARSARTSCQRWRRWKAWRRRAATRRCPMSPLPCTRTARALPRWTRAWPRAPRRPWVRSRSFTSSACTAACAVAAAASLPR